MDKIEQSQRAAMEQYPIVMASSPELHRQDPSPDTLAPCHDEDPADYIRDFVSHG